MNSQKKRNGKLLSILLALCMVFSLAVGACADDITASGGSASSARLTAEIFKNLLLLRCFFMLCLLLQ